MLGLTGHTDDQMPHLSSQSVSQSSRSYFAALYGVLFKTESEVAFSNYRMWESMGFIIAFAYSSFLCTSVKLIILTCVLVIGMLGYFTVEYMYSSKSRVVDLEVSMKQTADGDKRQSVEIRKVKGQAEAKF